MQFKTSIFAFLLALIAAGSYAQTNADVTTSQPNTTSADPYWIDLSFWPFGPQGGLTNAIWMMGGTPSGAMVDFRIGYDDVASLYVGKTFSNEAGDFSCTPMLGATYGANTGFGLISHTTWKPWRLKLYQLNQFMTGDLNSVDNNGAPAVGWAPYFYHWGTYTGQFIENVPVSVGGTTQIFADFGGDGYNIEAGPSVAVDFPADFYLNACYYFSVASDAPVKPGNTVFIGFGWMHEFGN